MYQQFQARDDNKKIYTFIMYTPGRIVPVAQSRINDSKEKA